jgi:hypothetical protein
MNYPNQQIYGSQYPQGQYNQNPQYPQYSQYNPPQNQYGQNSAYQPSQHNQPNNYNQQSYQSYQSNQPIYQLPASQNQPSSASNYYQAQPLLIESQPSSSGSTSNSSSVD